MPPKQTPANTELQDQLAMLMSRLENMELEIDTLRSQSRIGTPASVEVIKEPTVSKPEPFSGMEDLSIFLQQCELSFELQPSRFPTDYQKVGFILSYLRGPAARWARPYLSNKAHELRNDLSKFTDAIEQAYGDPTRRFRATIELRSLKQTTTAACYAADFQAIASNLSWNDEALCSQFYEGLADPIKDEVSKNPPATLREFIIAAIRIDNRRVERPAPERKSSIRTIEPPRPPSSSAQSQSSSKPLKLDPAERARCAAENRCFRCREVGHRVINCPMATKDKKEPPTVPVSFMIGGTPGDYPQVMNVARRTGPRESEVGWRSKVTPLVEQA